MLKKAMVRGYDSGSHTATVQISGSHKAYLEGVSVAANIAGAEVISGRKAVLAQFDGNNPQEAVLIAVYA